MQTFNNTARVLLLKYMHSALEEIRKSIASCGYIEKEGKMKEESLQYFSRLHSEYEEADKQIRALMDDIK